MEVEITSYYFYHISNPKPYNCGNHLSLIIFEYGQYWTLILLLQKKKKNGLRNYEGLYRRCKVWGVPGARPTGGHGAGVVLIP